MDDKVYNFLDTQLERVSQWLTFAEAKNIALITFSVAVVALFFDIIGNSTIAIFSLVLSALSCGFALWSFFPQTDSIPKNDALNRTGECNSRINLVFWKDIASLCDDKEYLKQIDEYYFKTNGAILEDRHCIDLSRSIVVNSRIARYKYKLFTFALRAEIGALILLGVATLIAR